MGLLEGAAPGGAAAEEIRDVEEVFDPSAPLPVEGDVSIREVDGKKGKKEFVRISWRLHGNRNEWVPPLEMDRMRLIDTEKNPFYRHARLKLFIADRGGEPVGRIAAIINDVHNRTYNDRIGFFGFFESIDDQNVANALLNAAIEWLRGEGMDRIRGPVSPSTNDEVGLLIKGFEHTPAALMPWNPEYYVQLLENAGFSITKKLLAWHLKYPDAMTDKIRRVTTLLQERGGISIRRLDMKHFPDEVDHIKRIYNDAWEANWGFVPLTGDEMDAQAYELKQIIDPDLVLFAEKDGEPVGFALAVPDINQAFLMGKKIPPGARNLPTAIMNLMTNKKNIDAMRIITLGVLPKYHGKGVDALLYRALMENGHQKGMTHGEASWVLEDNTMMNRAAEMMNGEAYKVYGIYEKAIQN